MVDWPHRFQVYAKAICYNRMCGQNEASCLIAKNNSINKILNAFMP